ncbi:MAG: uracil-DNA glycosylase family protein [Armatimonadota bacterium]
MDLITISRTLAEEVDALRFAPPVAYTYNPLNYARQPHEIYLQRFGGGTKDVLLLGMNPGPFGMAQTGVPFGDVNIVREWLGIEAPVERPACEHPKRPVDGFACGRGEVSGQRLWGWARQRFGAPEFFFARFFVVNYCPLAFLEEGGKNRTPDKLPTTERAALYAPCDAALRRTVEALQPKFTIGIGNFALARLREALDGYPVTIDSILHPSPANPQANAGWAEQVEEKLSRLGIL